MKPCPRGTGTGGAFDFENSQIRDIPTFPSRGPGDRYQVQYHMNNSIQMPIRESRILRRIIIAAGGQNSRIEFLEMSG